ncbi:MAG: hypothetical protein AAGA57_07345 [Planctomycetota bacterium]
MRWRLSVSRRRYKRIAGYVLLEIGVVLIVLTAKGWIAGWGWRLSAAVLLAAFFAGVELRLLPKARGLR